MDIDETARCRFRAMTLRYEGVPDTLGVSGSGYPVLRSGQKNPLLAKYFIIFGEKSIIKKHHFPIMMAIFVGVVLNNQST